MSKQSLEAFNPASAGSKEVSLLKVATLVAKRLGIKMGKGTYLAVKTFGGMIPIEKCYINYDRQRYPEPSHIKKLIEKWNPFCVTSLECRYDAAKDRYYIADGQQHGIAWTILYYGTKEGNLVDIPANFFASADPDTESRVLLGLNCDNKPMAKYFIHDQQVKMREPEAVALETVVLTAGCKTGYKIRSPGAITHFPNLYTAVDDYGLGELEQVLKYIRLHWPLEAVETDMMIGLLKVRELMANDPNLNKNLYEDIFDDLCKSVSEYFSNSKQAKLDIMKECERQFPDSYRGVNKRFPLAAGMIDVYMKNPNKIVTTFVNKPLFDIKMP